MKFHINGYGNVTVLIQYLINSWGPTADYFPMENHYESVIYLDNFSVLFISIQVVINPVVTRKVYHPSFTSRITKDK